MGMFVPLFGAGQPLVSKSYFRGISQVVKFDGNDRVFMARIAVPPPCEDNFFKRLDLLIRAEYGVHIPAFMVHFDAIPSSHAQFQFRHDGGIFRGGSEPASQFSAIGPRAEDLRARRAERSFYLKRYARWRLRFVHARASEGCCCVRYRSSESIWWPQNMRYLESQVSACFKGWAESRQCRTRPFFLFLTRPARSRTCRCFITAGSDILCGAASAETGI